MCLSVMRGFVSLRSFWSEFSMRMGWLRWAGWQDSWLIVVLAPLLLSVSTDTEPTRQMQRIIANHPPASPQPSGPIPSTQT